MSSELDETIALANVVLDKRWPDPDDDLRMLARQFLRAQERIAQLESASPFDHYPVGTLFQKKADGIIVVMTTDGKTTTFVGYVPGKSANDK